MNDYDDNINSIIVLRLFLIIILFVPIFRFLTTGDTTFVNVDNILNILQNAPVVDTAILIDNLQTIDIELPEILGFLNPIIGFLKQLISLLGYIVFSLYNCSVYVFYLVSSFLL